MVLTEGERVGESDADASSTIDRDHRTAASNGGRELYQFEFGVMRL